MGLNRVLKAFWPSNKETVNLEWQGLDDPSVRENYSIQAVVSSNALTISVTDVNGNAPGRTNPVYVAFRNPTLSVGEFSVKAITSPLSITIPNTATMGHVAAFASYIYIFIVDTGGQNFQLAVSSDHNFDEGLLHTTTAISTAADSDTVLYSPTAWTSRPIRRLGRMLSTQSTAGVWATAPSEITPGIGKREASASYIRRSQGDARGSTNTFVVIYAAADMSSGTDITYVNSSTLGDYFQINTSGIYSVSVTGFSTSVSTTALYIQIAYTVTNSTTVNVDTKARFDITPPSAVMAIAWTGYIAVGQKVWTVITQDPAGTPQYTNQITIARMA